MTGQELVPFGKYKGQSVEILRADEDYCNWLMTQDWFRSKFSTIYQTIINYGGEPQETPEHNELQASFLDDERCFRLAQLLYASPLGKEAIGHHFTWRNSGAARWEAFKEHLRPHFDPPRIRGRKFEADGWDIVYEAVPTSLLLETVSLPACTCGECDHAADCNGKSPCRGGDQRHHYCRHETHGGRFAPTFEWLDKQPLYKPPGDYSYRYEWWRYADSSKHCSEACPWSDEDQGNWLLGEEEDWRLYAPEPSGIVRVECKPDLGDDFPAVLRQVTSYKCGPNDRRCVIARRASFEKVTWEQVEAIFAASRVVLLRESQLLTANGAV